MVDLQFDMCHNVWSAIWTFSHSCWLQGSRIVQRYIDHKKLQRLMKDISGFTASQRMEPGQPVTSIDPKQVHSPYAGFYGSTGLPGVMDLYLSAMDAISAVGTTAVDKALQTCLCLLPCRTCLAMKRLSAMMPLWTCCRKQWPSTVCLCP